MMSAKTRSPRIDGNRAQAGRKQEQQHENSNCIASPQARDRECGCFANQINVSAIEQADKIKAIASSIAEMGSPFTLIDLDYLALEFERARALVAEEARRSLLLSCRQCGDAE